MTESERVARELLAYRDNPPVRQAGLVEGQWYESGDILWIIMAPRCEFTTHELLTRLAELMWRGTCQECHATPTNHKRCKYSTNRGWRDETCHDSSGGDPCVFVCSRCGATYNHPEDEHIRYCPDCGRKVVES